MDRDREIELDFSNVDDIKLDDLERILLLQKFAVFNQLRMKAENMKPSVMRIFEQTGLYKMMNTFSSNKNLNIRKRQGLAFDQY